MCDVRGNGVRDGRGCGLVEKWVDTKVVRARVLWSTDTLDLDICIVL